MNSNNNREITVLFDKRPVDKKCDKLYNILYVIKIEWRYDMQHTDIVLLFSDSEKYVGTAVKVCGWVRTSAEVKPMTFIQINDGTTSLKNLQLTIDQTRFDDEEYKLRIKPALPVGTAVYAEGELVASERNVVELLVSEIRVLGECPGDYPLQKKKTSMEFLRTIPHLRLRTNTFKAVFTVRARLSYAIHKYFNENGYKYVQAPIITNSDCEGAGEMFRVTTQPWATDYKTEEEYNSEDYFGCKAGLAVSCQLEGEMAALGGLGRIYTFGPSFRAEHSNTARHVAEFWHVEPEVCFVDLDEIIEIGEDFIKFIIRDILESCKEELAFFDRFVEKGLLDKLNHVVNSEFAKVDYTEAVEILQKSRQKFEYPVYWGADLQSEHERYLTEEVYKRPVFLKNYPKEIKAFYMKQNPDGKTVAATDLLVPGIGEIIGCSERETDLEKLQQAMRDRNMPIEEYTRYLDTRRFGSVQHSGFGLGLDRMVMYVTGMTNIRDVLQFPRTYEHIY